MKLSSLSKKQQYVLIGAVLAVAVVVIVVCLIQYSFSSAGDIRAELEELTVKIENADRTLANQKKVSEDYRNSAMELIEYIDMLPPDGNLYSWTAEITYSEARKASFEIESIDEMNLPEDVKAKKGKGADAVQIKSFTMRILAHSGYAQLKSFLSRLETSHPLVRVASVDIRSGENPEMHDVQLVLEWPVDLGIDSEGLLKAVEEMKKQEAQMEALQEKSSKGQKKAPTPPEPRPDSVKPKTIRQGGGALPPSELETGLDSTTGESNESAR